MIIFLHWLTDCFNSLKKNQLLYHEPTSKVKCTANRFKASTESGAIWPVSSMINEKCRLILGLIDCVSHLFGYGVPCPLHRQHWQQKLLNRCKDLQRTMMRLMTFLNATVHVSVFHSISYRFFFFLFIYFKNPHCLHMIAKPSLGRVSKLFGTLRELLGHPNQTLARNHTYGFIRKILSGCFYRGWGVCEVRFLVAEMRRGWVSHVEEASGWVVICKIKPCYLLWPACRATPLPGQDGRY